MKATAMAMKTSPDQKSFGERMRIVTAPIDASSYGLASRRGGARPRGSLDLDIGLSHDLLEFGGVSLDAGVELGGGRGYRDRAAAGEALLDVGQSENPRHLVVELVEDRLRGTLGRKQRGPVRDVDRRHAALLQGRPFRVEARALGGGDGEHADAPALEMRKHRGDRQHAARNIAGRERGGGRRAALVGDMLELGAGAEPHP